MGDITKEKIDDIFLEAVNNNLLDIKNQFASAMEELPEQKDNPVAYAIIAASFAQGNVMAAMKEICYKLLLENS